MKERGTDTMLVEEVIDGGSMADDAFDGIRDSVRHAKRQSSTILRCCRDPRAVIGALMVLVVVVLTIFGPLLAPYGATEILTTPYARASQAFPLGADVLGRDVLSRVLYGGGVFMLEGVFAAFIGVGLGSLWGVLIGFLKGRAKTSLLFVNDAVLVIPQILLVLIILSVFSVSPLTLVIAVAIAQIPNTARVAQAATKRVVNEDYYTAAIMIGESRPQLLFREVIPNIAGPLLVEFGVRLAVSFVVLASLSYLGFGDAGSWGTIIHENQGGVALQPFAALTPVFLISVFLVGMNLLRDALSRVLSQR